MESENGQYSKTQIDNDKFFLNISSQQKTQNTSDTVKDSIHQDPLEIPICWEDETSIGFVFVAPTALLSDLRQAILDQFDPEVHSDGNFVFLTATGGNPIPSKEESLIHFVAERIEQGVVLRVTQSSGNVQYLSFVFLYIFCLKQRKRNSKRLKSTSKRLKRKKLFLRSLWLIRDVRRP